MNGDIFKALADPTRRDILQLLKDGDLNAGMIAEHFTMSKPSISHHLSVLKNSSLVTSERRGQEIVYSLNTTVVQDLVTAVMRFADQEDSERGTAR